MIQANKIVIKPLQENYTIIEERVSNLEQFMLCNYRWKNEEKTKSTKDHFVYGHLLHTMIQEFCKYDLSNPDKDIRMKELFKSQKLLTIYPQYFDIIEPYFELMYSNPYKAILTNHKVFCEVEAGPYLLVLTGEFDMLVETENNKKAIIDLKFSKSEWKQEKADSLRQRYLYPYLFCADRGRDDLEYFEYCVLTKHQKQGRTRPRIQKFRTEIDKQLFESKFKSAVVAFLMAYHKNNYETKLGTHCYTCKLKSNCPAR